MSFFLLVLVITELVLPSVVRSESDACSYSDLPRVRAPFSPSIPTDTQLYNYVVKHHNTNNNIININAESNTDANINILSPLSLNAPVCRGYRVGDPFVRYCINPMSLKNKMQHYTYSTVQSSSSSSSSVSVFNYSMSSLRWSVFLLNSGSSVWTLNNTSLTAQHRQQNDVNSMADDVRANKFRETQDNMNRQSQNHTESEDDNDNDNDDDVADTDNNTNSDSPSLLIPSLHLSVDDNNAFVMPSSIAKFHCSHEHQTDINTYNQQDENCLVLLTQQHMQDDDDVDDDDDDDDDDNDNDKADIMEGVWSYEWVLNTPFGTVNTGVMFQIELTCSDGIFCNGMERLVSNQCSSHDNNNNNNNTNNHNISFTSPCDDMDPCTIDTCEETNGVCRHELRNKKKQATTTRTTSDNVTADSDTSLHAPADEGADAEAETEAELDDYCATASVECGRGKRCMPNCTNADCGSNFCGGRCGVCPFGFSCSSDRVCINGERAIGTCFNPLELAQYIDDDAQEQQHADDGDDSNALVHLSYTVNMHLNTGVDSVSPTCFADGTASDLIYELNIPAHLLPPPSQAAATSSLASSSSPSSSSSSSAFTLIIDARVIQSNLSAPALVDTVLEIRYAQCMDQLHLTTTAVYTDTLIDKTPHTVTKSNVVYPQVVGCNDDSVPPGFHGSRVTQKVTKPGTYYIIVTQYPSYSYNLSSSASSSSTNSSSSSYIHSRWITGGLGLQSHPLFPATKQIPAFQSQDPEGAVTMTLTLRQVKGANSVPFCDDIECGSDGVGGECGPCNSTSTCVSSRCIPFNCVPTCGARGRSCHDDGCGGSCTCPIPVNLPPPCDELRPRCLFSCGVGAYCATNCTCLSAASVDDALLSDLIVSEVELMRDVSVDVKRFTNASCAVTEKCIEPISSARGHVFDDGNRKLLRFTVTIVNQGYADMLLPKPDDRPDLFHYSPCHKHFHFERFAQYSLLSVPTPFPALPSSSSSFLSSSSSSSSLSSSSSSPLFHRRSVVRAGRKAAFCLEDGMQAHPGNYVSCQPTYNCTSPGISAGWSDIYGKGLDCQWIDVTGLEKGDYILRVEINVMRTLIERSTENNVMEIGVTLN